MKIELRCSDDVKLEDEDRAVAMHRIWSCFDRHAAAIDEVRLHLRDENGPRGGVDIRGVARVHLKRGGTLVARAVTGDAVATVTRVAACVERALARRLGTKRALRATVDLEPA